MKDRPSIAPAFILILLGVIFLLSNAGMFEDLDLDIDELWPVYPLIGGVAFVMLAIFGRDRGALWVGLVAIAVAVIALPFTLSGGEDLEQVAGFWPVLLVLIGGWHLLQQLFPRRLR